MLQTPETRVCCLMAGDSGATSDLLDSSNCHDIGSSTPSASASSVLQSFDDKSDSSVTSSSSHADDGSVSQPTSNGDQQGIKTIEKVTFSALVDVCSNGSSDGC